MRKFVAALSAVLAIAVVAAGCGGGGDSTGAGSTTDEAESGGAAPTKAAFIKEADKICSAAETELVKELTSYAEDHGISTEKEPDDDQKVELTEKVVLPNLRGQAEALEALTPPEGDEAKVEEITGSLSGALTEAEEDPTTVLDGKLLDDAAKKAQDYGLHDCG